MDMNEIDLEFMEQDSEDRLTQQEAVFLGLPSALGVLQSTLEVIG